MTLSKKTLDMLECNGYSFKEKDDQITCSHSSSDRIGLFFILLLCLAGIVIFISIEPLFGLGALIIAILIFLPIIKRNKGRFKLKINKADGTLKIDDLDPVATFKDVSGVYIHSKFVDEYSSAFKSTSKEYRVTIGLEIKTEQHIPLFKLISDHAKPSKEMNEVQRFLESTIQKGK